ncbi:MAG TPA: hypothetical protein VNN80_28050 [Polyangiaceae bacterium]|nr:hypothetical protein [Polyangiaceae bacterium]
MTLAKFELEAAKLPPLAAAQPSSRILHMDRHQALVVWDHLVLVMWRGDVDAAAVHRLESAVVDVLRRHRNRAALMGVVEPTATTPSTEMRKASSLSNDRMTELGLVGIAGVLSQHGFAGSLMRGVITGLTLLSRTRYPFKVFDNHDDGALWLSQRLAAYDARMPARECALVVARARRHYAEQWARAYGESAAG